MTERENCLRAIGFRGPEWIPCSVAISSLTWHVHREEMDKLALRHPRLFPDFTPGSIDYDNFGDVYTEGQYFRDNWGCLWYNTIGGLEGQVVEHPLADWSALATYRPPDPKLKAERTDQDWDKIKRDMADRRNRGLLAGGWGERLFDRLYLLRGFENLMMDIATDDPHLATLIEMLTEHELKLVDLWLDVGVDAIGFHTDIGSQKALMISPESFRKHIKPMFKTVFSACRDAGALVALSSDGVLTEIVDDLIECGVNCHDPQLRANTLDGIERAYKGKLCANVDLDRQMYAFCRPEDIREQVREVVERMYSPEGGLMVMGSVWDAQTSLENIEALCFALEEFCLTVPTSA